MRRGCGLGQGPHAGLAGIAGATAALALGLACDGSARDADVAGWDAAPPDVAAGGAPEDAAARDLAAGEPFAHPDFGGLPGDEDAAVAAPDLPPRTPRVDASELPEGVPPPRLLVPGAVRLVGAGGDACSHQMPASGDGHRWCAFYRAELAGATELWVIDVTAAAAGATIACDGQDAACRRLSATLWMGPGFLGPTPPYDHRFFGDTLIYYADAQSRPEENFRGSVYAWRPGWARARRVSTAAGFLCAASARTATAVCLNDLRGEGFDLLDYAMHAGALADRAASELPLVARMPAFGGLTQLSPDGEHLAFSNSDPITGESLLRVVATRRAGQDAPRTIVVGAWDWQIAHDGRAVYFLDRPGNAGGVLSWADFPSGENRVGSGHTTRRYVLPGSSRDGVDRGAGLFTRLQGSRSAFELMPDRARPQATTRAFEYNEPLESFGLSHDGRFVGFAHFERGVEFNGYIARTDGGGACALNDDPTAAAVGVTFLADSSLALWAELGRTRDGWAGDPTTCGGRHRFGERLGFYLPVRDRGLVVGDLFEDDTVTLRYVAVGPAGAWPAAGPVRVADWVDLPVALLSDAPEGVVYTTSTAVPESAGLHLFAPPWR